MRQAFAVALLLTVGGQILAASAPAEGPGPIAQSIREEAQRVSRDAEDPIDPEWRAIRRQIQPGDDVLIVGSGIPQSHQIFVAVSDTTIIILVGEAHLPDAVMESLRRLASSDAHALVEAAAGLSQQFESLELSDGWLRLRGVKVAPLLSVIRVINASEVTVVHRVARRASARYIVGPTLIGAGVGVVGAVVGRTFGGCGAGCAAQTARVLLIPIAYGVGIGAATWAAHRTTSDDVVFHRP